MQDILAGFQQGFPHLAVLLHGYHGGGGWGVTQHLIIGVTIKSGQVKALMRNIIHDIGKGQQMQLVPLQLRGGEIGGCIGRDHKRHDVYLSQI